MRPTGATEALLLDLSRNMARIMGEGRGFAIFLAVPPEPGEMYRALLYASNGERADVVKSLRDWLRFGISREPDGRIKFRRETAAEATEREALEKKTIELGEGIERQGDFAVALFTFNGGGALAWHLTAAHARGLRDGIGAWLREQARLS